jgi:hypothetical protein
MCIMDKSDGSEFNSCQGHTLQQIRHKIPEWKCTFNAMEKIEFKITLY